MASSPTHIAQGSQVRGAMKSQQIKEQKVVSRFTHQYKVGAPWTTEGPGPQMCAFHHHQGSWLRSVYVRVCPRGSVWQTHQTADTKIWGRIRPRSRAISKIDGAPGQPRFGNTHRTRWFSNGRTSTSNRSEKWNTGGHSSKKKPTNPRLLTGTGCGPHNPKRSKPSTRPPFRYT